MQRQPPKMPKVPTGTFKIKPHYRILGEEIVQQGDQWYSPLTGGWNLTKNPGYMTISYGGVRFRRKVS